MPASIIPTMRYENAPAAIDWLCAAFGFERHLVVPGEGGSIAHAQLTFEGGMIMLGSRTRSEYDDLVRQPREARSVTMSPYIIVSKIDEHYERD